jgi:hypothetical protein
MCIGFEEKVCFFKEFGNFPLAYTITFDDSIKVFADTTGFLGYAQSKKLNILIGNPISSNPKEIY